MNASVFRNTKFELISLAQGPNSFAVRVLPRDGSGQPVELDLPESLFTYAVMTQIHTALEALEDAAAIVFAKHEAKPEDLHATINAAAQAKKDLEAAQFARAQLEVEALARRADLDAEFEAKRAEAAKLGADMAQLRAEAGITS